MENQAEMVDDREIVAILEGYRAEAEQNRRGGLNPRDEKWRENLDAYWNRYDFSGKARWQARETLATVPAYVDRFAAALKEALISSPDGFYTIEDPADTERDLVPALKKVCDTWLARCGRSASGEPIGFPAVFEEQMKLGAIAACCCVVLWKRDVPGGRVSVETVDPRNVWVDAANRGLYRIRRVEVDRHELARMAEEKDEAGGAVFNEGEIIRLLHAMVDEQQRRAAEEMSGTGREVLSSREPVVLDEYLADIVGRDGKLVARRALAVVANRQYLIRRPEANPFWHGRDWVLFAPLVPVPLSPYGRSYMEDFGSIARTFTELTNMILDAVHTSALKAFVMVPSMLANPGQLAEGITPNKIFQLEDGQRPEDFVKELSLGGISSDAVRVWEALKSELSEAAKMNEIRIGQFAPKARTSATEIIQTQQSTSALLRSVAETVETTFLAPLLDLVWKTGLQHLEGGDKVVQRAVGQDMFRALMARRREFAGRSLTFRAAGISRLIEKATTLQSLIRLLQIVAASDVLLREFLRIVDPARLVEILFELSNIDIKRLQSTERQRLMAGPMEAMGEAQNRVAPAPPAAPAEMEMARQLAALAGGI